MMTDTTVLAMNGDQVENAKVRPEVSEIFFDVFQDNEEIDLQTSQKNLEKWDSLRHVALIAALESRFSISLSMDEMMEITCVADIHRVLERHGV